MTDDEDLLAGIDLQAWRVPPPATVNRAVLLERALSPKPPKRSRITWLVAALALINIALASIIVILLVRPTPTRTVTVLPAGGPGDAQVRDLLARLEQEQRELEGKLAETKELHAIVTELSEKVKRCEERDRTVQKQPPIVPAPITPAPITPTASACDEVSCVLANYPNGCCDKYKNPAPIIQRSPSDIPETLDRSMIANGVAQVKARVAACSSTIHGNVKVHVRVDPKGLVTSVTVDATPDAALGACVASAMQKATFGRSLAGGSFSYPFVF